MNSNLQLRSSLHLGNGLRCESVFCVLSNIDVSRQLGPSTFVYNIGRDLGISDDRRVLLARADGRAISCQVLLDWELLAKEFEKSAHKTYL